MTPQEEGSQVTGQRSPEVTPSRPLCDSFTQQIPLVHLLCVNCFNLGDPGEPDNQRTHVSERGAVQGPGWHGPSTRGAGACRTAARAAPPRPPGEPPSWPHFFPLPPGGGEVGPAGSFQERLRLPLAGHSGGFRAHARH